MEDRLKPCPFCGGKTEVSLLLGNYGVTCTECMGAIFPAKGMTKKEAIEAWNTRKPIDRIVEQLEKMEEKALRVQNYDVSFYATGQMHKAIAIAKAGGKGE